ncbi:MAG: restriction endonuclease subunit S [Clostridia bacterium]|nr:restriction endonuclease subunit S [Clostridia bacterium]
MKIKDICTGVTDGSHNPPQGIESSDYLMLSSKNIFDNKITFENPRYLSEVDFELENKRTKISAGDVLLTIVGTVGRAAVVDSNMPCFTLQRSVAVLHPKADICNSRYLMYALQGKRSYIENHAKGIAQKGIYLKEVSDIDLIIPTVSVQESIVEILDKVASITFARQQELQVLDNLVKARFVEMFGGEDNPQKWNKVKLSEFCDLQNGYAFKSDDYIDMSGVLNCRMSNIRPDGGFDAEYHPKYLPEDYWDRYEQYRLIDGDVIIAMTDMASDPKILGVPTIVKSNGHRFLLNQRVGKLIFNNDKRMNRVYLMSFLSQLYVRKGLAKSAGGSAQINVGKPAVLNIEVFEPPLELQNEFEQFVKQVDKSRL